MDKQKQIFFVSIFLSCATSREFSRGKKAIADCPSAVEIDTVSPNLCISILVRENEQTHQLINTIQFCLKFTVPFGRRLCFKRLVLAIKCEEISNYSFHPQHAGSPLAPFRFLLIK